LIHTFKFSEEQGQEPIILKKTKRKRNFSFCWTQPIFSKNWPTLLHSFIQIYIFLL